MRTTTIGEALRSRIQAEIDRAPKQHSKRTKLCPDLARIPDLASAAWTDDERRHIETCTEYCQRMIALQWRVTPPSTIVLARFLAGQLPELKESVRLYFEENPAAKALTAAFATAVKATGTAIEHLHSWLGGVATTLGQSGAVVMAGAFADEQQPLFYWSWTSPDEKLHCALEETEEGALQLRIDNPSGDYGGCTIHVQVVFVDSVPLETDVVMRDLGSDGAIGTKPLGTLAELAPRLSQGFGAVAYPVQRTVYDALMSVISTALEISSVHRRELLTQWRQWLTSVTPKDVKLRQWTPVSAGALLSPSENDETIDLVITSANEPVSFEVAPGPVRVNVSVESWAAPNEPPLVVLVSTTSKGRTLFADAVADPDLPVHTASFSAISSGSYFVAVAPGTRNDVR